MIDADGFRPNVGIIVANQAREVLWAKRVRQDAWQFPQGGIQHGESPEQAMARELHEELGLSLDDVEIIGCTVGWYSYRLPSQFVRRGRGRTCIGQRQKWFVLRLTAGAESKVRFDAGPQPEFEGWRWVNWWLPLTEVVEFKRDVYRGALRELAPLLGIAPPESSAVDAV
ncbi:putative (di)nucleoside polyphosphate hydrolase [Panacagrimonas perspica]|uniref:RNA pyrophosphohydrolase n=1 Tax=Panacagrimonas perspica TaxID=381431 RepID=A0A4R7NUN2_9GAMM|nr:RNA pyrophosphohydrolase [Panacagrimonas perspica]TDU24371.1 putative (di)nucleoside polyphosphate hydrolase [Panacagrimonas perspica]THD04806.1 RNA pyrophosphohydrolase [Panacagrimonas perspica]